MFEFYASYIYSNAYIRTQNKQPQLIATYVEGDYEYRLRFIATIQSDNNIDDNFDRNVARIDLLQDRRQKQLSRIVRVEVVGRKHFTVLIPRDVVKSIDLNATRPYKIRLTESNEENTDEEAERRSTVVLSILRLIK